MLPGPNSSLHMVLVPAPRPVRRHLYFLCLPLVNLQGDTEAPQMLAHVTLCPREQEEEDKYFSSSSCPASILPPPGLGYFSLPLLTIQRRGGAQAPRAPSQTYWKVSVCPAEPRLRPAEGQRQDNVPRSCTGASVLIPNASLFPWTTGDFIMYLLCHERERCAEWRELETHSSDHFPVQCYIFFLQVLSQANQSSQFYIFVFTWKFKSFFFFLNFKAILPGTFLRNA